MKRFLSVGSPRSTISCTLRGKQVLQSRLAIVHIGQVVLHRERPGREQAVALCADVLIGGQRRTRPSRPSRASRTPRSRGPGRMTSRQFASVTPKKSMDGLGPQESRSDRQRRHMVGM